MPDSVCTEEGALAPPHWCKRAAFAAGKLRRHRGSRSRAGSQHRAQHRRSHSRVQVRCGKSSPEKLLLGTSRDAADWEQIYELCMGHPDCLEPTGNAVGTLPAPAAPSHHLHQDMGQVNSSGASQQRTQQMEQVPWIFLPCLI